MKSVYAEKRLCCGCGACRHACPVNAITMGEDREGFLYPVVGETRCIDCRNCLAVCPMLWHKRLKEERDPAFYAMKHRDEGVLINSASGGAFTAISDVILDKSGVVYGADFDRKFDVVHGRAATPAKRDSFRKSKYAQSATHGAYGEVVRDLREGRTVLFTGTPCQTAGLRGLMRKRIYPAKLYTCDVICHSVPSPLVWRAFKALLEKERDDKIAEVFFRSKARDWTRENMNSGFHYRTSRSDEQTFDRRFLDLFLKVGTIARPSCHACPYTDIRRAADITIGDYMGIEKYAPALYDARGVSLVLANSKKGEELLLSAQGSADFTQRPPQESLNEQERLHRPAPAPAFRDQFWRDYRAQGFEYVMGEYLAEAAGG